MINGWWIGNFEPSVLKTDQFEVAFQSWKKGDLPEKHYQKIATEYNLIIKGKLIANGKEYKKNDFLIFHPYEITDVKFVEDTDIIVVKVPSIPEDKYLL